MKKQLTTATLILFVVFFYFTLASADFDTGRLHVGDLLKTSITPDPVDWELQGENWVWTGTIYYEDAYFIKPHFKNFNLPPEAVVELYDVDMNLVASYTDDGPRGLRNFWSNSALSDELIIIATSPVQPDRVYFEIDQFSPGFKSLTESICGSDNLENINCKTRPTQVKNNQKAVAHIVFVDGGTYVCTGSLVSANNHFLTNNHCISNQTICNTMEVYFEYETSSSASCTTNTASKGTVFSCDTFLSTNATYDYGLMTLAGNPAGTRGHCNLNAKSLSVGEYLYIIQHPSGNPKKFADGTCYDNAINGNGTNSDCSYQIDTEGGSSGSPVFDNNGDVVALHHWGGCSSSAGNQGVLMSKIYPMIEDDINGTSNQLLVTVNITHTWIGDLKVELTMPSSTTVVLHNNTGSSADDIHETYSVSSWDGTFGEFTLKVSDHAGADTGTLDNWSIQATPAGGSTYTGSNNTTMAIPDNNATGITSKITL
ncbi:proprotein convertase P-domain-containing protein [candidate division CSSED10-310 bacterium]|uniref:Proprotein convertase P-domain-containing protein n=1 Tax=candidate division CSSED10-310 bacterium TaxID=2855610 RepID=A0ABV6YRX5_UNCC1